MCVCVCYHLHGRHTNLNFGMEIKWKDMLLRCVGQSRRSKVKVTRSKCSMPNKKLGNMNGRNMAWGVFKSYAVSLNYR